ncbi:MAG: hypothetical protein E7497_01375 [Ruminococcus sp.]|nr:hypothetical protein [Ruminococcus sp.]
MIAISLSAYSERRKQVITEDQQIAPGEVVHTQPVKRAPNNVPFCARHTIALHGSKQIVTIYDRQIKKGKTVLVVINPPPASPYMICVPKNAVDYDLSTSRYEHKEPYTDPAEYADYSIAELEDVVDYISPEENKKIIHKERLLGPFKYGVLSAIWMLFTVAAIVMVVFLIKSYIARQAEVFFPLMIGFLCEIIIEWILCKAVIKKKTSYLDSGILECVVSKKFEDEHINVKCIRVVIPERKQFVNLNVTVFDYKHLSLNERVTLVVKKSTGEVRWIIRK